MFVGRIPLVVGPRSVYSDAGIHLFARLSAIYFSAVASNAIHLCVIVYSAGKRCVLAGRFSRRALR